MLFAGKTRLFFDISKKPQDGSRKKSSNLPKNLSHFVEKLKNLPTENQCFS